jgi:hypothetical protein
MWQISKAHLWGVCDTPKRGLTSGGKPSLIVGGTTPQATGPDGMKWEKANEHRHSLLCFLAAVM